MALGTQLAEAAFAQPYQIFSADRFARENRGQEHIEYRSGQMDRRARHAQNRDALQVGDQGHVPGLSGDSVGQDARAQSGDGSRCQIIRIYGHAAGKDQKIGAGFKLSPRCLTDHFNIIVAEGDIKNPARVFPQLLSQHRPETVGDSAGIHFGPGYDHADSSLMIGLERQQIFFAAQRFGTKNLLFLGYQRHDPHGRQRHPRFCGVMVRQRGDRQVADGIDFPK